MKKIKPILYMILKHDTALCSIIWVRYQTRSMFFSDDSCPQFYNIKNTQTHYIYRLWVRPTDRYISRVYCLTLIRRENTLIKCPIAVPTFVVTGLTLESSPLQKHMLICVYLYHDWRHWKPSLSLKIFLSQFCVKIFSRVLEI